MTAIATRRDSVIVTIAFTVTIAFITSLLLVSGLIYYIEPLNDSTHLYSPWMENVVNTTSSDSPRFAFILQTEQCLSVYLRRPEYFGNNITCDCHVFVLSYKRHCKENLSRVLPHIMHVYKPDTTWSTGRNIAYNAARSMKHPFLYYIMMDDDIILEYNAYTPGRFKNTTPLYAFTDFLLEQEPAIAAPAYDYHFNEAKDVMGYWNNVCRVPGTTNDVIPLYHHDAAFEAFHRNAATILLPYEEKYDAMLYYFSAVVTTFRAAVAFYGQHVYFPYVKCVNPKHRYKKNGNVDEKLLYLCNTTIRLDMVEDVRRSTPRGFQKHPVFEFLRTFPILDVHAFVPCMDPPVAHSPIIPYKQMFNKTNNEIYPINRGNNGSCVWDFHLLSNTS